MKIRQVQIERFGAWHDVSVTLAPNGLTVLYGPNETGKLTLVRFLRSVLYGYLPQDELASGARPRAAGCAGELLVQDGRDELIVRRASAAGGQAELRRRSLLGSDSMPTLPALLGGVSRELYERVFAVGLSELQELATLQGDETSQFIYQLSLGDEGEQLIALLRQSQAAREALVGTRQRDGELQHWQRVIKDIDSQLAEEATADARHADLEREHAEIAARIDEQQWRQRGLNEQLRGHAFLERVWVPWQRHRRLQHELDGLPDVAEFPEDGAERLSQLESGIAGHRRDGERLNQTRRRLRTEFQRSAGDRSLRPHAPEIRHLLQSSDSLRGLEASLPALKSATESARRRLDEQLRQLGPGWSEARLEKIDPAPAAAVKLFRQADRYRAAARSRARCIRAYRRMATLLQQRQSEQAAVLRPYAGAGVRDARQRVRQELADLDDLRRLESQQQAQIRLLTELRAAGAEASKQEVLPAHFLTALAVLGLAGLVLAVAGVWRFYAGGGMQAAIVGVIFVLLGICCGGLIWTIKQRLESESGDPTRWRRREAEVQAELARIERDMQRLIQQPDFMPIEDDDGGLRIAGRDGIGDLSDPDEIAERFDTLVDQLTELGSAGPHDADLQDRRNRLSNMRERIRLLQRAVSQSRRDWCLVLKESGLDESVRVAGALEVWQAAQEARRQQVALREAQAAFQTAEVAWREFTTRIAALASQIDAENAAARPLDILNRWRGQLDMLAAADSRRAALRQELRETERTLRTTRQQHRVQVTARRELLASVGARDRLEFLRIDAACRRRQELEAEISVAADDLAQAAATEPELAIVEDDLLHFDGAANREAIATIETELSDLQGDLRVDHEQIGRVEQELAALEADRRAVALRYDREQADSELQRVVRQLSAVELASRGLESLRSQLERERQPQTLNAAGRYLQQLTAGKYQRVWAPLGEKSLVIDDERNQSFRVEQLSSGTREQLFLSIRLALIDEFLTQGIELPIVLDDLFVNFDQQRTEAAVRTVVNYAADGRQLLLLTCHQHLVKLFEAAGVATVRLPEQESLHDRRRVG